MKWGLWSTTAGSNSNTPPDGFPEGQLPSTLNDGIREMMAQIKVGILDLAQGYIDIGQSPTYVSAATFTTPTNDLSYMPVGGRLRFNVGSSVLYGTIVSASYSTNTFINVALDSGALTASLSSMAIGVTPSGAKNHFDGIVSISTSGAYSLFLKSNTTFCSQRFDCSGGAKIVRVTSASNMEWVNSANTVTIMTLTDAGALTCVGNITAFSDERLKDDWRPLPLGIVDKMAMLIKSGTFSRKDMPGRFVGVGAQSLREILPEAVNAEYDYLSVDYGPTALALCVELCREIGYLKDRIRKLEDKS